MPASIASDQPCRHLALSLSPSIPSPGTWAGHSLGEKYLKAVNEAIGTTTTTAGIQRLSGKASYNLAVELGMSSFWFDTSIGSTSASSNFFLSHIG